jgi:hypothetical protein
MTNNKVPWPFVLIILGVVCFGVLFLKVREHNVYEEQVNKIMTTGWSTFQDRLDARILRENGHYYEADLIDAHIRLTAEHEVTYLNSQEN